MSPRRNRPSRGGRPRRQRAPRTPEEGRRGVEAVESWGDEQWRVRHIPGSAAVKTYRCPGCDQEVRPGVAHVVAWPVDGLLTAGEQERRHWHTACWRARDRRRPRY